MRNTELYFAQTFCWEHNIFVVVKPINNLGKYRLAISRNGREKLGDEIYEGTAKLKWQVIETAQGIQKKIKVLVPPVHERIKELYIDIYNKNFNIKPVKPAELITN